MFFVEAEAGAEEPASACSQDLSIRLTFEGDPPGIFRLRLARTAADCIAADFLGEDAEDLSPRQSHEVACELANMICGAVLSRIESRGNFRLSAPELVADDDFATAGHAEETAYTVETGNGTLTAAIQMETRACPASEKSVS